MNKKLLEMPIQTAFTGLWTILIWANERKKKQINSDPIYQDLMNDVIQVHKQIIDESKEQPLIDLLERRRKQLDPQLTKRLEKLSQWKKDNMLNFSYDLFSTVWPAFIASPFFPRTTAWIMCCFSFMVQINVLTDRQLISGGKEKTYFAKNVIPQQEKLMDGFRYIFYGVLSLSVLKMFALKMNKTTKRQALQNWKKNQQKK